MCLSWVPSFLSGLYERVGIIQVERSVRSKATKAVKLATLLTEKCSSVTECGNHMIASFALTFVVHFTHASYCCCILKYMGP